MNYPKTLQIVTGNMSGNFLDFLWCTVSNHQNVRSYWWFSFTFQLSRDHFRENHFAGFFSSHACFLSLTKMNDHFADFFSRQSFWCFFSHQSRWSFSTIILLDFFLTRAGDHFRRSFCWIFPGNLDFVGCTRRCWNAFENGVRTKQCGQQTWVWDKTRVYG